MTHDMETEKKGSDEKDTIRFEDALARLEQIVAELEKGETTLETSLALFEEGVKLIQKCSDHLDAAEARIRMLLEDDSGQLKEVPFTQAVEVKRG